MLKLEVFETAAIEDTTVVFDAQQVAKLRETAYEQGYAAGWQDALEHMRNEDALRRIASEDALQGISFSYHEAHGALQQGFIALLRAMLDRLLPEAARLSMVGHFDTELRALVARTTHRPIRIRCAPSSVEKLAPLITKVSSVEIELVAEPSFTEAQVSLSLDAQERIIDLDNMLDALRDSLDQTGLQQNDKEISNG